MSEPTSWRSLADQPRQVAASDLRGPDPELPRYLGDRLEAAGLDHHAVRRHLVAGTLLEVHGIGPGTLRRVLGHYTTLDVPQVPPPGGRRPRAGRPGFGPGTVTRKVRLWRPEASYLVAQADARGIPRAELARRAVSLLHSVTELDRRRWRSVVVPRASGADPWVDLAVQWPQHLWVLVADSLAHLDTNAAGIMRAGLRFARDNPELAELLDVAPEVTPDALRELLEDRRPPI